MLMFGGHALQLRGEPLDRPEDYQYDTDVYGTLDELTSLRQAVGRSIGRLPLLSPQIAPGRFTLRSVGLAAIEFDSLTPDLLELAETLPDNRSGNWFGLEVQLASPLTVHLIKLAYVERLPSDLVHPKHGEDIGKFGGKANLIGSIAQSKPHKDFYTGLSALIDERRKG